MYCFLSFHVSVAIYLCRNEFPDPKWLTEDFVLKYTVSLISACFNTLRNIMLLIDDIPKILNLEPASVAEEMD